MLHWLRRVAREAPWFRTCSPPPPPPDLYEPPQVHGPDLRQFQIWLGKKTICGCGRGYTFLFIGMNNVCVCVYTQNAQCA